MYDRILFPTDGSDVATSVFDYALDVASAHEATVHVLNVADTTRDSVSVIGSEVVDVLETEGEQIVSAAGERAAERDVSVVTDVLQGDPYETIVDYSREFDVDLVVMPTHGRQGLERFLLGSVTERVINTSDVPVLTVNPDEDRRLAYPPESVLVPTDGSRGANLALHEGIQVAKASGATLHVLHVLETESLGYDVRSLAVDSEVETRGDELVEAAVETAEAASLESVTGSVTHGRAYREILSYVEDHDVDLVAIGTHGQTMFNRYVLGSVTTTLVRTSPVPLLMVRDPDADE